MKGKAACRLRCGPRSLAPYSVLAVAVRVVALGASATDAHTSAADQALSHGSRWASSPSATHMSGVGSDAASKGMTKRPQRTAVASHRNARSRHRTASPRAGRRVARHSSTPTSAPESVANAASVAVRAALAQLGKPYVLGQAGPRAFDCSGLTQYAWGAAGVRIPRTSQQQARFGRAVEIRSVRPGDVVVYYGNRSHVALYVGSGRVVYAPHPGADVRLGGLTLRTRSGSTRGPLSRGVCLICRSS